MERQAELDWLRGTMLVLMTFTHLPTWFGTRAGQPFGYVSAAEGFVFLSAYLVGSVYGRRARVHGVDAMRRALWWRTLKVYAIHAALLLFLLLVLVPFALSRDAHAITDLASYYVARPRLALASGLLLSYNPPLLDILPMYVVFLAASPLVLRHGLRHGFGGLLAVSSVVWLFAQYDGGRHVYQALAALVGWPVPYAATGAFVYLAWQLLWLVGLYLGARPDPAPALAGKRASRAALYVALAVAAAFFAWRHLAGQVPFANGAALNALVDKWHLGPLRLLNFAVLAWLVVRGRRVLREWADASSIAVIGRSSLAVFAAHLVICLTLLATIGDTPKPHLSILEINLVAGTLLALYGVARVLQDMPVWAATFRQMLGRRVSTRIAR
jgi:hypothetical protein